MVDHPALRILVYTPTNARAVDLQSVMELFVQMGHEVFLLSQKPEGDLHRNVRDFPVQVFGSDTDDNSGVLYYIKETVRVRRFLKKHRIDVVFAHLQGAGFIAGLACRFCSTKLFYVRHNTDEHKLYGSRKASLINKWTNQLAPAIIAPSETVYKYLIGEEHVDAGKVFRINYGYNFNLYKSTDSTGLAASIREEYPCSFLIVSVARLVPAKRHTIMFDAIAEMLQQGLDVKMICVGTGPIEQELKAAVQQKGLADRVFIAGSRRNVFDYLEASDVFLHLSETEASNSAVKEAGYCGKTVVVCRGVGDFADYVEDGVNGFLVPLHDPLKQALAALVLLYHDAPLRVLAGQRLKARVEHEFAIENVRENYKALLDNASRLK